MRAATPAPANDVVVLQIAEGGMGYVELVVRREGRFLRLFARKRLHPALRVDQACRAMFLDEARLAGLIRHPNVTAVLQAGEDGDGPFLLMEYVEGPSVAEIIARIAPPDRPLPLALCVSIAAQAARGLHAAHELVSADGTPLGLVHRDISPRNLLVGYDGLVRVADFGIAKARDNVEQTRVGVLKGNIGYMAPECLRFQEVDRRSDLFSLGVVLYELLTRERLYGGDDAAAIARRILDEPPPDVFEVRDVPPELAALLFNLLAKQRELRPTSALAVAAQLEAIAAGLAAADGPFDMPDFLAAEIGIMRQERQAAIQAALAVAPARARKRSWRARAVGAGAVAVALLAMPAALRHARDWRPPPSFEAGRAAVWSGGWHSCALRDERLVCWGSNIRGQLGDGTTANRDTPVTVRIGPVRAVAAGEYHTCALTTDGRVSCWGRNVRGEVGRPEPTLTRLPLAVEGVASATAIAAGRQHTCALVASGQVVCWGANESGQLGRPPAGGAQPALAVAGLPAVRELFAGGANTCARLASGELRCWGANESGQLGDGTPGARAAPGPLPGADDLVALAIGNSAKAGSQNPDLSKSGGFMCGVSRAGQVLCWGSNSTGQLGDGTRTDRQAPVPVLGISDAVEVAAGDLHACARRRSGRVSCWGRNEFGAVGDDTMGPSTVRAKPVEVVRLGEAVGLALGGAHSCARRAAGEILCWGVNNFGQLGDGSTTLRPGPQAVSGVP